MLNITNETFLKAIFGENAGFAHVTDFTYDPANIPNDQILLSWLGNRCSEYKFTPGSNQYYTISIFNPAEDGRARRRKSLYLYTPVIVLDDVREKLNLEAVNQLPKPSYILETSPGSEQWGYILNVPATDRHRVENLIDGLIVNGLSPDSKDPGMKGVTRYVRLPEGSNTKEAKKIDGKAFKCRMLRWEPNHRVRIEDIASPFCVDLEKLRKEVDYEKPVEIKDHPILEKVRIKSTLSPGRYDITCPWFEQHTGQADNGTALFTNSDGTIGFRCHHGHCEGLHSGDLIKHLDDQHRGFATQLKVWQFKFLKVFGEDQSPTDELENLQTDELSTLLKEIQDEEPKKRTKLVEKYLTILEDMSKIDAIHYHEDLIDCLGWTKQQFGIVLKDFKKRRRTEKNTSFYDDFVFIHDQNRFFSHKTKIFYSPDGFQNSFSHVDAECRKQALTTGLVSKVDKMDFFPKMPKKYTKNNITFVNSWDADHGEEGCPGDASHWLAHWDVLGWGDYRDHMLKFMAYTIKHPEEKINHALLLGGLEGVGKDYLLYPLVKAMCDYSSTINGNALLESFQEYLFSTKHLHINEIELGDHRKANEVETRLKPLLAAPPDTVRVNIKFANPVNVQNLVNVTMSSNSRSPVRMKTLSRRFYAVWTDLSIRDDSLNITPEWSEYWHWRWVWMKKEGYRYCIHHLKNNVDISNFRPGSPPPVTPFLREINEGSKSPAHQTVEAFIRNRVGAFKNDLITISEIVKTLRAGLPGSEDAMFVENNWFTPVRTGRVMSEVSGCLKLRARGENELSIWAVRDIEKYSTMTGKQIFEKYFNQCKEVGSV